MDDLTKNSFPFPFFASSSSRESSAKYRGQSSRRFSARLLHSNRQERLRKRNVRAEIRRAKQNSNKGALVCLRAGSRGLRRRLFLLTKSDRSRLGGDCRTCRAPDELSLSLLFRCPCTLWREIKRGKG